MLPPECFSVNGTNVAKYPIAGFHPKTPGPCFWRLLIQPIQGFAKWFSDKKFPPLTLDFSANSRGHGLLASSLLSLNP